VVLERTNARHLTNVQVPEPVDMVVCDASFIALAKILPPHSILHGWMRASLRSLNRNSRLGGTK